MKKQLETIDLARLQTATGGINWGSIINSVKPFLQGPGPTVPLGPYTPPKPDRTV